MFTIEIHHAERNVLREFQVQGQGEIVGAIIKNIPPRWAGNVGRIVIRENGALWLDWINPDPNAGAAWRLADQPRIMPEPLTA